MTRLTVIGTPVTKKNSSRIVHFGKRPAILPSAQYKLWEAKAVPQLRLCWSPRLPLEKPVNVAAVIYRQRAAGDLVNFLQAIADVLEVAGVVKNDRWIVSWNGSRLDKDAKYPRVELVITEAT